MNCECHGSLTPRTNHEKTDLRWPKMFCQPGQLEGPAHRQLFPTREGQTRTHTKVQSVLYVRVSPCALVNQDELTLFYRQK